MTPEQPETRHVDLELQVSTLKSKLEEEARKRDSAWATIENLVTRETLASSRSRAPERVARRFVAGLCGIALVGLVVLTQPSAQRAGVALVSLLTIMVLVAASFQFIAIWQQQRQAAARVWGKGLSRPLARPPTVDPVPSAASPVTSRVTDGRHLSQQVLDAAKKRNVEAWSKLVEELGFIPWIIAKGYGLDRDAAGQVVQRAWTRLVHSVDNAGASMSLNEYLAQIAGEEARHIGRSGGRSWQEAMPTIVTGSSDGTEQLILAALDALPQASQRLIWLTLADPPLTPREVRAALELSQMKAVVLKHRAVRQLKNEFDRLTVDSPVPVDQTRAVEAARAPEDLRVVARQRAVMPPEVLATSRKAAVA